MRGRMTGKANRGNKIAYGEFGIQALQPGWITSNQIEAARIQIPTNVIQNNSRFINIILNSKFLIQNSQFSIDHTLPVSGLKWMVVFSLPQKSSLESGMATPN